MTVDLTLAQIAELTGKTKRTVSRWIAEEGMPAHESSPGLETSSPARDWLDWYIKRATSTDYNAERTRLTKLQADKQEMENEVRREELMEKGSVLRQWAEVIHRSKTKLLALPSRVAPLVQATDGSFVSVRDVVDKGVREALDELSEGLIAGSGSDVEDPAVAEGQ